MAIVAVLMQTVLVTILTESNAISVISKERVQQKLWRDANAHHHQKKSGNELLYFLSLCQIVFSAAKKGIKDQRPLIYLQSSPKHHPFIARITGEKQRRKIYFLKISFTPQTLSSIDFQAEKRGSITVTFCATANQRFSALPK